MNVEEFREYCLSLPHVTEKMPFTMLKDRYSRDVQPGRAGRNNKGTCRPLV